MSEAPVITEPTAPVQTELPIAEAPKEPETTTESAPAAPAEGEKLTGDTPERPKPGQGKHRLERRIDAAYRARAEAEARAKALETELQQFKQPKDPGEPKLEQFDDIEKYADAKAKYQADKLLKEERSKKDKQSFEEFQHKVVADWEDRSSTDGLPDDFEQVVGQLNPASPLHVGIMQSDPRVAYYLGTHLDEAQGIAKMDFVSQLRAIGRIEAKVTAETVKPKPSKAPAPIKPVTGTADTSGEPDSSDTKAWIAWRQKKVHKR